MRVRHRLAAKCRNLGLQRRNSFLVAVSWALSTTELKMGGYGNPLRPRILILPRPGGIEDADAILSEFELKRFVVAKLPTSETKNIWNNFFREEHPSINDFLYKGDGATQLALSNYRLFLVKMMRVYLRVTRTRAVLSANWAYYAERELAAAVRACGVPFLVIHKESVRSPRQRVLFERTYQDWSGRFSGTAIAVYNEAERQSLIRSGVAMDNQVSVVGCPRLDYLHTLRRGDNDRGLSVRNGRPLVVLFDIAATAGVWSPIDFLLAAGEQGPRWQQLAYDTVSKLHKAARECPEYDFVIKTKSGVPPALLRGKYETLPSNLTIRDGGVDVTLAWKADVAIAFNSITMMECTAAGTPLIVPHFGEARDEENKGWLIPNPPGATVLHDDDDLLSQLRELVALGSAAKQAELSVAAAAYLQEQIGNADGVSRYRGKAFVLKHVRSFNASS